MSPLQRNANVVRASAVFFVFILAIVIAERAPAADINSTWSSALSGNWTTPTNWNPVGVPNNGTQTFAAFVTNPGTYTITLNSAIAVESVLISTTTATLSIGNGGTLTAGSIQINGGTLAMAGGVISGAAIIPGGTGTVVFSGTGNRLTNNAVLQSNLVLPASSSLLLSTGGNFTGASATLTTASLGHDTNVNYVGRTFTLTNSTLSIDGNASMTIGATSTVRGSGTLTSDLFAAGNSRIINNGSILSNVAAGTLRITSDEFTNTSQVLATANASLLAGGGTFTNSGTVSVTGGGSFAATGTFLGNSGTITVAGNGSISGTGFSNSGLVEASAGTMVINAGSWTNTSTGTLRMTNGTLSLNGTWSSPGTISVTNSQLNLGGTFSLGSNLIRSGGTVNLTGFLDNSGSTLNLNATTGSIQLTGGTIAGGTINQSGGSLTYSTSSANRLNGVTLLGNLAISDGRVALTNNATFTGNAATLTTGALGFDQTATLSGRTITLSTGTLSVENGSTLTIANDSTVRGTGAITGGLFVAGPATVINNGSILSNTAGGSIRVNPDNFINNGTMIASGGASLTASGGTFTNNARLTVASINDAFNSTATFTTNTGTIQLAGNGTFTGGAFVNSGTLNSGSATLRIVPTGTWLNSTTGRITSSDGSLILGGVWSNSGTISITNTLLALGGTISTGSIGTIVRSGGTVNLTAVLNNTGTTLMLTSATGDWQLTAGVISGGTVLQNGGNLLYSTSTANRLTNDAVLVGDLIMNSGRLGFGNGANFTGANATITTAGVGYDQSITLTGKTFTLTNGTLSADGTSLVTLAPNTVVQGSGAITSGLLNTGNTVMIGNGFVTGNVAGQTMRITAADFTNNGSITTVAGASFAFGGTQFVNNGTVSLLGIGSFGNTIMENNGLIESTGGTTLNIAATNWSNNAGAIIRMTNGTLNLSGMWSNAGTIQVNNATLNYSGTFNTASALRLDRSGGTVSLTGFLNNNNATLALTGLTGSWRLNGATISGGTITQNGGSLTYANVTNRFQNGAKIFGDLEITGGRALFANGSDFTGTNATITNGAIGYEHTLTLANRTISMTNGTFSVDGNHTLTIGATSTVRGSGLITSDFFTAGESRTVNSGTIQANLNNATLTITTDALYNNGTLQALAGGKLVLTNPPADGNLGRVRADGASSLVRIAQGTYSINQPITAAGGLISLLGNPTRNANIDVSGRVVFDFSDTNPSASLIAAIATGYAGGAWTGPGIFSTAAQSTPRTGVGYALSTSVFPTFPGNFGGELVDNTAFLMVFTLYGDTDLNRVVNIGDFSKLASNFNRPGDWSLGDFDYNGVVNISDFSALASNFNQSLPGTLPRASAVPEPVGVFAGLILIGAALRRTGRA